MSSAKWRQFCPGKDELITIPAESTTLTQYTGNEHIWYLINLYWWKNDLVVVSGLKARYYKISEKDFLYLCNKVI